MAVETIGTLNMRGESQRVGVTVQVDDTHLRVSTENAVIGDWTISDIGIAALHEGFAIRAEGEEFVLHTKDDAAVAEGLGLATASPRIARMVAASHPPEERIPEPDPIPPRSQLGAVAFGLGGVLVVAGGVFLPIAANTGSSGGVSLSSRNGLWLIFVIAGILMLVNAFLLARWVKWAQAAAIILLGALAIVFVLYAQGNAFGSGQIFAYGLIAGGLVVGVAVLFSGTLGKATEG